MITYDDEVAAEYRESKDYHDYSQCCICRTMIAKDADETDYVWHEGELFCAKCFEKKYPSKRVFEHFVDANFVIDEDYVNGSDFRIRNVFEFSGDVEDWPSKQPPKMIRITVEVMDVPERLCTFCGKPIDGKWSIEGKLQNMHYLCNKMNHAEYLRERRKDGE